MPSGAPHTRLIKHLTLKNARTLNEVSTAYMGLYFMHHHFKPLEQDIIMMLFAYSHNSKKKKKHKVI